jgi:hypothetical protein
VHKLPAAFHEDFTNMIRIFWWREEENKKRVHWAACDSLTYPKCMGGVGFRVSKCFNQGILARQA